jgi:hypothetical protein
MGVYLKARTWGYSPVLSYLYIWNWGYNANGGVIRGGGVDQLMRYCDMRIRLAIFRD